MSISQTTASQIQALAASQRSGNDSKVDAQSFALQLAQFQSQTLNTLISAALGGEASDEASQNPLFGDSSGSGDSSGLSASGRNTALFDPESGYRMMSVINQRELNYQAEFAALSQMQGEVANMAGEGLELAAIGTDSSQADIETELSDFVSEYNDWVREFDDEVAAGGALADSNAAHMSRYELDQSVENTFNGAEYGLRGLADIGLTIDPTTKLASLDASKLASVLASNRSGTVDAIHDFSANFVKSAELLNADNNFIENRLGNLERVISYIDSNKQSLQNEFGLGDAGSSKGIADALAAYRAMAADAAKNS